MVKNRLIRLMPIALLFIAGCLAGPNTAAHMPDKSGNIAGLFSGVWHGMIALFTFVISLFTENTRFYEVHNNGGWYDFGFLVGFTITAKLLFSETKVVVLRKSGNLPYTPEKTVPSGVPATPPKRTLPASAKRT